MPVGAGSIKRAAKAAGTAVEPRETLKSNASDENVLKEDAGKKKEAASVKKAQKSGKDVRKSDKKKKPEKKPVNKPAKKAKENSRYEVYAIGQQLPIHLL